MLKNKIYKYFFDEILKNFITILLTFTAIAWVVRAVNFLDLMVVDGYSSGLYFKYSLLNITSIMTRFVPLSFLLSLTISIIKFERQQELMILWTTGLAKIKVANIFLLVGLVVTVLQLILSLYINPLLLNKSRSLLSSGKTLELYTILKSNDFSDTFKGITFFVGEKNDNELKNIFIKDQLGALKTIVNEAGGKRNSVILAENGFISEKKLILFNGMIQTLSNKNEIKNILFEKTELSLTNVTSRIIKQPKIQETSSSSLLSCIFNLNYNLSYKNCSNDYKNEAIQNFSRRLGSPLYIPLITIITCFLLIYKKEKTYVFLKKYALFILSFVILVFAEIVLKYISLSLFYAIAYFVFPLSTLLFFYVYLFNKLKKE